MFQPNADTLRSSSGNVLKPRHSIPVRAPFATFSTISLREIAGHSGFRCREIREARVWKRNACLGKFEPLSGEGEVSFLFEY